MRCLNREPLCDGNDYLSLFPNKNRITKKTHHFYAVSHWIVDSDHWRSPNTANCPCWCRLCLDRFDRRSAAAKAAFALVWRSALADRPACILDWVSGLGSGGRPAGRRAHGQDAGRTGDDCAGTDDIRPFAGLLDETVGQEFHQQSHQGFHHQYCLVDWDSLGTCRTAADPECRRPAGQVAAVC